MSLLFYRINRMEYQLRQHEEIHDQLVQQLEKLTNFLKGEEGEEGRDL